MATQLRDLDVDLITRGRLERRVASLGAEFGGTISPETVERYVIESLGSLPARRIQEFIPLLVHRFARERLRALAQVEGKLGKDVPAAADLEAVRRIRDEVARRVGRLVDELAPALEP